MKSLSLDYNTADAQAPHLLVSSDKVVGRIRDQDDAEAIVRACNTHDNLVGALIDLMAVEREALNCPQTVEMQSNTRAIFARARAALSAVQVPNFIPENHVIRERA